MKKIVIILIVFISIINLSSALAQTPQYTPGPVWTVSMVHTKANMEVEYLNSLKANWKAIVDEAKAQGLIMDYMILEGDAANSEDFDIMLMVKSKDLATMEANREKWEAVRKKVMPDEEAMKKVNQSRVEVRDIYGSKMMREVIYK